jgi:hypothetical protein
MAVVSVKLAQVAKSTVSRAAGELTGHLAMRSAITRPTCVKLTKTTRRCARLSPPWREAHIKL